MSAEGRISGAVEGREKGVDCSVRPSCEPGVGVGRMDGLTRATTNKLLSVLFQGDYVPQEIVRWRS